MICFIRPEIRLKIDVLLFLKVQKKMKQKNNLPLQKIKNEKKILDIRRDRISTGCATRACGKEE